MERRNLLKSVGALLLGLVGLKPAETQEKSEIYPYTFGLVGECKFPVVLTPGDIFHLDRPRVGNYWVCRGHCRTPYISFTVIDSTPEGYHLLLFPGRREKAVFQWLLSSDEVKWHHLDDRERSRGYG